jgi:hypothetical protein
LTLAGLLEALQRPLQPFQCGQATRQLREAIVQSSTFRPEV